MKHTDLGPVSCHASSSERQKETPLRVANVYSILPEGFLL